MDSRRRRQAENELMFRSINERIEDLNEALFPTNGDGERVWDFVCECHDTTCIERLALTTQEYEAVRADGTHFVVSPADRHVDTEIENVIEMSTRYWVVEKTDESGETAEAADPRE